MSATQCFNHSVVGKQFKVSKEHKYWKFTRKFIIVYFISLLAIIGKCLKAIRGYPKLTDYYFILLTDNFVYVFVFVLVF